MKNNLYLIFILLFLSCEEVQVDDLLSDFSTDNIPSTTIITIDSLFESSSVNIEWAGNEYANSFSYKLKPLSYKDTVMTYYKWSDWDTVSTVTFDNLDEGDYTFFVKSRYTAENEEIPKSKNFNVNAITGCTIRLYPSYQVISPQSNSSLYLYMDDCLDLMLMDIKLNYNSTDIIINQVTADNVISNSNNLFNVMSWNEEQIIIQAGVSNEKQFMNLVEEENSVPIAKIDLTIQGNTSINHITIDENSSCRNIHYQNIGFQKIGSSILINIE